MRGNMIDIKLLEKYYNKFVDNLKETLPEGIINVDIEILKRFDLLNYHQTDSNDNALTRYFHVIESNEKITLINDDFIVWIVPEKIEDVSFTYTIVALNSSDIPKLEVCFITTGVYNTSRLVLRVLEKFLYEIQENEELLKKISGHQAS
jgi:hypothetical protein